MEVKNNIVIINLNDYDYIIRENSITEQKLKESRKYNERLLVAIRNYYEKYYSMDEKDFEEILKSL